MAGQAGLKEKIVSVVDNVKYYWTEPPKGRYMTFKEIVSYAVGGIGAYFIITMGTNLIVSTTNMIVGGAIGIGSMDMYVLYLIATLANIPLTGIRAIMIDNTRGKGGKYRPYLLSMGLPTAIISIAYVWFPYDSLYDIFSSQIFGRESAYVIKCAVVLIFNLLLQFFYNFFNDAYTNLIHVLSPNTQERTDVLSIKAVVYSLAPSIINIVLPLIAQFATNNDLYDLKVYRIAYPIFAVIGILLTIVVFANTQEKIVQAKTHTIQISFTDSLKAVAKNKYFWIISLAGWIGFLEGAYGNVLTWSYNYGHTVSGGTFALIQTLTGNAALWGMLMAPFFIRKFGKKRVLLAVNCANIICILAMLINTQSIWWLFICVYFNWMVGSFEQILSPSIQADIRDYQQYKSGERIDGMFAAVLTIGNLVTLLTSSVLPAVQEYYGIKDNNGYASPYDILDVNTGEPGLLYKLMAALILMAAAGAFLNMVPYFFYDFNEKKQKSVIRVLKVRSLFEDYGNNALTNHQIVETIDMVEDARKMAAAQPKVIDKNTYKSISDNAKRKEAKKKYRDDLAFNEEIEISQFVCKELDKFNSEHGQKQVEDYTEVFNRGLQGIVNSDISSLKNELASAKLLPKNNEDEIEYRKFKIEFIKKQISAKKYFDKYYGSINAFVEPSMENLISAFDYEDELDKLIVELNKKRAEIKKDMKKQGAQDNSKQPLDEISNKIKDLTAKRKAASEKSKELQDEFAKFNRAAKPYIDSRKALREMENFSHFDEIADLYDEAKANADKEDREKEELAALKRAEQQAELEAKKAEKARRKNEKSNKSDKNK
ncbi:MAG: MFS transporter [Clostridiales bacterium]|nr:MFS transporter [Clostridiales bacterium]